VRRVASGAVTDGVRLAQVTLVVGSTAASADFYRRLGLAVPAEDPGVHVEIPQPAAPVSLELDAVESASLWNASWRGGSGTNVVIGVSVPARDAVDALYAELTGAGAPAVQPPFDAFWGGRYAIVADPDGNQVGLMSPVDGDRAAWPPPPSPDP
jgi:catechol 2,3-dioxygenase-like lactoylglutathione lyase family enzyme